MKYKLSCIAVFLSVLLFAFFLSPSNSLAATINLSSNQSQIGQNDEYAVNVNLSINVANGTSYFLRGAFYSSGTTNYCGYTYNGTDWYNGPYTTNSGWQHVLQITVNNSSWSGTLKAKLDPTDSGCNTSGTYNFKIQRFTNSGSGTFDLQNEQIITVVIPTAVPTSVPTPSPTTAPSATQKPTAVQTIKPTAVKSISLSPTTASSFSASISGSVLGSSVSPTLIAGISEKKSSSINMFGAFSIIGGILLLSSCGILFFYKWKKTKNSYESTDE